MSPRSKRETYAVTVVVTLGALSLLYTAFLSQPIRLWFVGWSSIVVTLLLLYLLWRFVRAAERIADALE